jgi:hypothetical protein
LKEPVIFKKIHLSSKQINKGLIKQFKEIKKPFAEAG